MNPKRIIFIHGLESGTNGRKAKYLHKYFDGTEVPDLQMGLFDWNKKNSAIRNFFSLAASMDSCINVVLTTIKEKFPCQEDLLLVGSSWGGAIALRLLCNHGIRPWKTFLLAPALRANGYFASWYFPNWIDTRGNTNATQPNMSYSRNSR